MQSFLYSRTAQGITLAVLLLALGGFWLFAVQEEKAISVAGTERLDDEKMTVRRMELERDRAVGVVSRYQANLTEIDRFREHFLENKDERLVKISACLDERTRARNVNKDRIDYQTARGREKDLEIYQISMPLVGRYRDIRALIGDIEASDLFLIITQLTLDDESGSQGAVRVQLSMETYFQAGGSRE